MNLRREGCEIDVFWEKWMGWAYRKGKVDGKRYDGRLWFIHTRSLGVLLVVARKRRTTGM